MPVYRVTAPDGTKFKVNAPEGATEEEALAYAQEQFRQTKAPQATVPVQEPSALSEIGHGTGLVARSLVNAVAALPAMGADAVTGILNQFLPGEVQGNNPSAYQPSQRFKAQLPLINDLLTKAGLPQPRDAAERVLSDMLASSTGTAGTAKAAEKIAGKATPLAQNIATQWLSSLFGSGASSTAREAGVGPTGQFVAGLGGSMVPVAAQTGLRLVAPNFTQAGRDDTKGRLLNQAAGEQRPAVLQGLDQAKGYVPGERPTTAQAAQGAGAPTFAALEKEVVSKYRPDIAMARDAENEAARLAAVQAVGKDVPTLNAAIDKRDALANLEYGLARIIPQTKSDPALVKVFNDPFVRKEVPDAIELLKGRKPSDNLVEFLQNVKIGIDQKIARTGDSALSSAQKAAALDAKEKLLNWLDARNPIYAAARSNYAQRSEPINQMQIGQYLENKLTSPLTGSERPGMFAQAMRDAPGTIRRASGGPRFENLSDVLTPQQTGLLGGVRQSLAREAATAEQANLGGPAARTLLGSAFAPVETPQLLNRAVSTARFVLEKIGVSTKNKSLEELAKEIQDPARAAELMRKATPSQWAAMQEVVKASTPAALLGNIQTWPQAQP